MQHLLLLRNPVPEAPTVSYGGQVYKTESIGKQCWLKENLNIGKMINSDEKPEITMLSKSIVMTMTKAIVNSTEVYTPEIK